jgi:quercetin dioxygenase-like cupin family protein
MARVVIHPLAERWKKHGAAASVPLSSFQTTILLFAPHLLMRHVFFQCAHVGECAGFPQEGGNQLKIRNLFQRHQRGALAPQISFAAQAGETLMVTHLIFEAGAVGALHEHPHEQLTLVLSGEIEFALGDECRTLKAGDAVTVPGNMPHGAVALSRAEVLDIFTPIRSDLLAKLER